MQAYDMIKDEFYFHTDFKIGKSNYWIIATPDELKKIQENIGIIKYTKTDYDSKIKHQSSINFFDDYLFLSLNVLNFENNVLKASDIKIFLCRNYILTIYKENIDLLNELMKDISNSQNCFILKSKPEPSIVLYYLLDRIIIRNYEVISKLEYQADKIEINILKNPRHEQIDQLITLRRQVYKIKKYLNPLRYIGDALVSNENSIIEQCNIVYFESINSKIEKLMMALEALVQDLALVREAFESEIANKTNELMKIFTLIATIFLPLNLITSMHGMNYDNIPFCDLKYGYYIMIGVMCLIASSLVILFKKKKWL
ncbi:magnesium transport protein CorA [Clostridium tepidiprofundi DSM 19306]|uniref:Magnesium transport protein CorA n=1 Tax=Clostridium tepidiprofundi DSM 19306 TaxID=1121338 RepID=A0A151B5F1_9CLOT|nr:magnesium transporter CorA family protein [Clostridium tepidiprofundi]KYH35033.1 magnesium transport protein CorA [Clostridium tepidiprofundi DSM 19306]